MNGKGREDIFKVTGGNEPFGKLLMVSLIEPIRAGW
jgi:hypothetical protein